MRIRVKSHFRKLGRKKVFVRRHNRTIKKQRNFGAKPNFVFERIPAIKDEFGKSMRLFHKQANCQKCGEQLSRRGGYQRCKANMLLASNFSSFTDLGPVSELLDRAEKELEQKKIKDARKVEAMPIETLPEFEKKEQARERLEKDIREEEQLLKKARGGLGNG